MWTILFSVLNLAIAGTSVLLLALIKQFGESALAGAKAAAEESAKTAVQNINWAKTLQHELEKSRGLERQELRFKSYGELWKRMRPLAIYSDSPMNRATLRALSEDMSDWYFSESGGMYLLPHTRNFYFSLQDFTRRVGMAEYWECKRYEGEHKDLFDKVVENIDQTETLQTKTLMTRVRETIETNGWPGSVEEISKEWRKAIEKLADQWNRLTDQERFATVQQIGSILRTVMVNDVESRLR